MSLVKVKCAFCGKKFFREKGRFNEAKKFGWNQYCSKKCQFKNKTKKRVLSCENCGKSFERTPSGISSRNYCSRSCAAIINNRNYQKRKAKKLKCKNCGEKFKKWGAGNKKYCSLACRNAAERYNPEKLLEIIKEVASKINRTPARRELYGGVDKACIKFFGSWNKAIESAGLTPNRSHDDRMYKRSNAKALDGHLCDSISELLIDNWLYQNNIPHERNAQYPGTHHKADWQIISKSQKIFIEYFGLANDSPRYDRAVKEKKELCRKHKIKLIEIYHWDLYPKRKFEEKIKKSLRA